MSAIKRVATLAAVLVGMAMPSQAQTTNGWSSKQDSLATWMLGIISNYENYLNPAETDHRCWSEARQMNTHEGYAIYGLLFPDGDSIAKAREIMRNIEFAEWKKAKENNNWKEVYDFAGKYRYGYYFEEAMALAETMFSSSAEDINQIFEEFGFCFAQDSGIVFLSNTDNDGDNLTFTISDSKTGRTILSRVLTPGQYKEIRLRNGEYKVVIGGSGIKEPKHGKMRVANKIYYFAYYVCPTMATIFNREELEKMYSDSTIAARDNAVLWKIWGREYINLMIARYEKAPYQNAYIDGNMMIVEGRWPEEAFGISIPSYTSQEVKDLVKAQYIDTGDPLVEALVYCGMGITYRYTGDVSGKTVTVSFSPIEMILIAAEIDTKISEGGYNN